MGNYNIKPTIKQKKVFAEVMNGTSFRSAMIKAGYSIESATNPRNVTESVGWKQLVELLLPDEALVRIHAEGLHATIKKPIAIGKNKKGKSKYTFMVEKDHNTRFKYLDLAYKIKGRYNGNDTTKPNWAQFWRDKMEDERKKYS